MQHAVSDTCLWPREYDLHWQSGQPETSRADKDSAKEAGANHQALISVTYASAKISEQSHRKRMPVLKH